MEKSSRQPIQREERTAEKIEVLKYFFLQFNSFYFLTVFFKNSYFVGMKSLILRPMKPLISWGTWLELPN